MSQSQPYNWRYDVGEFYFDTDKGLTYSVGFSNINSLLSPVLDVYDIEVYDIEFFPVQDKQPYDERVALTLVEIIEEQIADPYRVLVYVCDSKDGRGRERQALFLRWHRNMSDTTNCVL